MTEQTTRQRSLSRTLSARGQALAIALICVISGGAAFVAFKLKSADPTDKPGLELSSQSKRPRGTFHPTAAQWAALTIHPVERRAFRAELNTDGKIAVDE